MNPCVLSSLPSTRCLQSCDVIGETCFLCPRGEMDIIQVSGTWGLGSIPGEGRSTFLFHAPLKTNSYRFFGTKTLSVSRPCSGHSTIISGSGFTNVANLLSRNQV